ncbi:MAG: cbb3-type cytochrome c oxidase subunit I, partial [Thiotrichales bacterium]
MDTVVKPQYNDGVVKAFTLAAIVFLVLGTFFGTYAASELAWPFLNFDTAEITFGRLRVIHTNTVIYAFGGNVLMATAFYIVQRTNGRPLYSNKLAWIQFFAFQAGLLLAVITLALGMSQAKEYHELEWPLDIAVALVWILFTFNFTMTIAERDKQKVPHIYVANWFFFGLL